MAEEIPISQIIEDPTIQPRSKIKSTVVDSYAAAMRSGAQFPAIDVFEIDNLFFIVDGFHRYQASRKIGRESILAEIHQGSSIRDAIIFAAGTNTCHGIQRTNADKKRIVQRLLNDAEWALWSNVAIANACQVSEHFVRSLRDLSSPGAKIQKERKVKRKGTTYTVNTEHIGKSETTSHQSDGDAVLHQDPIPAPIKDTTPNSASPLSEKPEGTSLTAPITSGTAVENPAPLIKETAVMQGVCVKKPIPTIPGVTVGSYLVNPDKNVQTVLRADTVVMGRLVLPDEREKWFTDLMKCTFSAEDQKVILEMMQSGKFVCEMDLLSRVVQSVHYKIWPANGYSPAGETSTSLEGSVSGSNSETIKNQSR